LFLVSSFHSLHSLIAALLLGLTLFGCSFDLWLSFGSIIIYLVGIVLCAFGVLVRS